MIRRKRLVDDLIQSSAQEPWGQSAELCFKILYGLPANLQMRLACFVMSRYLPIFESKWKDITWPRQILNNIAQWADVHGRDVPEEPETADAADAAFSFAFDGLLLAYAHQNHDFTLTSSSVFAIDSAINARETNVWMADDPEAYQMWEEGEWLPPGHTALENAAAMAVSKREWQLVAKWLQQEEVWNYPDNVDCDQMEEELACWLEREMLLSVPREEIEALRAAEMEAFDDMQSNVPAFALA